MFEIIFVVAIPIVFTVTGLISVARPEAVRAFVAKDHRAALKWWGKNPEDTENWIERNLVRPVSFRIAGVIEILLGIMALWAVLRTYILN